MFVAPGSILAFKVCCRFLILYSIVVLGVTCVKVSCSDIYIFNCTILIKEYMVRMSIILFATFVVSGGECSAS